MNFICAAFLCGTDLGEISDNLVLKKVKTLLYYFIFTMLTNYIIVHKNINEIVDIKNIEILKNRKK